MYITAYTDKLIESTQQVDIFDMFFKNVSIEEPIAITSNSFRRTRTVETKCPRYPFVMPTGTAEKLIKRIDGLDRSYTEFRIPKASGGYRKISAPNEELKEYQRAVVWFLKNCGLLYHDCAFAYIENRSTKHALQRHQENRSNWFMKLDLKDFFPSCTMNFTLTRLWGLWPICEFDQRFKLIFEPCFLNGALPQGSPASPFISNLVMLGYDYEINKALFNHNKHRFIYTRYADDILISSKEEFDPAEITEIIRKILPAELRINNEKTRYGSKAGRNWNLGLMLNQHNEITLGYKEKQRLRAAVYSFVNDLNNGVVWPVEDKAHLQGQLAYLKYIEPNYHAAMLEKYNRMCPMDIIENLR